MNDPVDHSPAKRRAADRGRRMGTHRRGPRCGKGQIGFGGTEAGVIGQVVRIVIGVGPVIRRAWYY